MSSYLETVKDWKKPFFTIWAGQAFSLFGSSIVQFAFVWYLTEKTGSAIVLGIASAAGVLPEVILGPFVGALVDRIDRKKVMVLADLFIMSVTLIIAVLFWTGEIQFWHIYAALLCRSLGSAFQFPAVTATTSLMVPEEHLARVAGLNHTLQGGLSLVAPPLGAFLMSVLDMQFIISIDVVTALIAVSFLIFVFVPSPEIVDKDQKITPRVLAKDIVFSVKYIFSWRGLFMLMLLGLLIQVFVSPTGILLPLLVTEHFQGDAIHLGGLESLYGLGIIIGGLLISIWGGFKKRIYTLLMGTIGVGISLVIFGFLTPAMFAIALGCYFVVGLMTTIQNASFMGIVQAKIPNEIQGKVFSSFASINMMFLPIVYLFAGSFAEFTGLQVIYLIAGIVVIIGGIIMFTSQAVRNIDDTNGKVYFKPNMVENQPVIKTEPCSGMD